jgi:uncharacterized protein
VIKIARVGRSERDKLEEHLRKLAGIGNVDGAAIVSRDGLLIADSLPKNVDSEIFSSMSATMHGAGETAISELKKGVCNFTMAESDKSLVISMGINPTFLVVSLATKGVNLGLLRVEMKKTAEEISKIL